MTDKGEMGESARIVDARECPDCGEYMDFSIVKCPYCGHEFKDES